MEPATPQDHDEVEALWGTFPSRPDRGLRGHGCLVARSDDSGVILGAAEYTRTFPPEDGVMSVMVATSARRQGIGTGLLRTLAMAALRNGIRNLGTFLRWDDEASWHLLAAAGIPVRVYKVRGGAFIELDLVYLLTRATASTETSGDGHSAVAHREPIGAVVDTALATTSA